MTSTFSNENIKANEYLYRRVDIEDVVSAHLLAEEPRPRSWLCPLHRRAPPPRSPSTMWPNWPQTPRRSSSVSFPIKLIEYARAGWEMFPQLDRVYDNTRACSELGWFPV